MVRETRQKAAATLLDATEMHREETQSVYNKCWRAHVEQGK